MASNITNIKKLQRAINSKGEKILYTTNQWYSKEQDRPITTYTLKKAVWDPEKQKYYNVDIFKANSTIQILLFLRDYWYELNGMEIPTDNEEWNEIKKETLKRMNLI